MEASEGQEKVCCKSLGGAAPKHRFFQQSRDRVSSREQGSGHAQLHRWQLVRQQGKPVCHQRDQKIMGFFVGRAPALLLTGAAVDHRCNQLIPSPPLRLAPPPR